LNSVVCELLSLFQICLARALVRASPIVVMDEATAALDFETDQLMRHVVQSHFKHATVLCIAHRLNTILDADRIMVFDAGRLVEFDSPKTLLAQPQGYLSWLVAETNSAGKLYQQPAAAATETPVSSGLP
jgi:ATP-binding cassette subfamily C (CFTR/MRP) protein 1